MPQCLALSGRAGLAQVNQDPWGLGWTNVHAQGWGLFRDTKLKLSFLGSSAWSSSKACVVTEVTYKAGRVTDCLLFLLRLLKAVRASRGKDVNAAVPVWLPLGPHVISYAFWLLCENKTQ